MKNSQSETAEQAKAEENQTEESVITKKETEEIPGKNERVTEEIKIEEQEKDPKEAEIEKLNDRLLRQAAEYDNYRKRTAKERVELESEITGKIISKLLSVLDNLDRAISFECSDGAFKKGVELINESFLSTLAELGVEEIRALGEDFDPNLHQAVGQVENPDFESGQVAEVFQKGYKIGEKVIRFAMVSVVS
ncbi:MAG: nucleotide exchange factor GrpE [Eubacterium sp.]|jgi:molecular chaperone GrpE|nr:nucleotide exchange factor GrpE [Eubacterium sp.]